MPRQINRQAAWPFPTRDNYTETESRRARIADILNNTPQSLIIRPDPDLEDLLNVRSTTTATDHAEIIQHMVSGLSSFNGWFSSETATTTYASGATTATATSTSLTATEMVAQMEEAARLMRETVAREVRTREQFNNLYLNHIPQQMYWEPEPVRDRGVRFQISGRYPGDRPYGWQSVEPTVEQVEVPRITCRTEPHIGHNEYILRVTVTYRGEQVEANALFNVPSGTTQEHTERQIHAYKMALDMLQRDRPDIPLHLIGSTTHSPKGNTMAIERNSSLALREIESAWTHTPLFIDYQMLGWYATDARDYRDNSRSNFDCGRDNLRYNTLSTFGYRWNQNNILKVEQMEHNARVARYQRWQDLKYKASNKLAERIARWDRDDTGRSEMTSSFRTRKFRKTGGCWMFSNIYVGPRKDSDSQTLAICAEAKAISIAKYKDFIADPTWSKFYQIENERAHHSIPYAPLRGKLAKLWSEMSKVRANEEWLFRIGINNMPFFNDLCGYMSSSRHDELIALYQDKMPHFSDVQPGFVAYIQSYQKMCRVDEHGDYREPLFTRTSPGKWLTMVMQKMNLTLTPEEVKNLVNKANAIAKGCEVVVLDNDDPQWKDNRAALEQEWFHLYKTIKVDYSCMRGCDAVRLYGRPGNHLRLVYWKNSEGLLMGRAICRTDTTPHQYVRCYPCQTFPEGFGEEVARKKIEALGYVQGNLGGIVISRDGDMCPYIDSGNGDDSTVSEYNGGWMICSDGSGDYGAMNTDNYGYIEGGDGDGDGDSDGEWAECGCCGRDRHTGDMYWSDHEDCYFCSSCEDNGRVVDAYVSRNSSHTDRVLASNCVEFGGEWYVNDPAVLRYHDIEPCPDCGDLTASDDFVTVLGVNGEIRVCSNCSENDYIVCEGRDVPVHESLVQEVNGVWYHEDDVPADDEQQAA